jgi:hypothetical protein
VPAASWYTPAAPFAVTPSSPPQYYQATLAWSYRHDPGEINYPRVTNRMLLSDQGTFLNIQDGDDTAGRQFIAQAISWGWSNVYLTAIVTGFLKPSQTHNFVMLFSQTGALSGGNTVQLWCNGTLVASTSTVLSDFSLYSMTLLGEGSTVLPGETQGFWFSGDTAIAPATVFAELFDGANGMLDLNADPTIDGVTPDSYHMEPGAGGGGAVASGTADVTGAATGTLRNIGTISGVAGVTGAASGSLRVAAAVSGVAGVSGAAAGSLRNVGAASGTAGVTGAAVGVLKVAAVVAGIVGVTGSATGTLRNVGAASGTADVTGSAAGAQPSSGAVVSGTADVTGSATGSLRVAGSAAGVADVNGVATGTLRATAVAAGTVDVTGAATGTLKTTATASGTADVTGSAEGDLSSGVITAEVAGIADVTGQATGSLRVIAIAAGLADVTGTASDLGDTSRHFVVAGIWPENTVTGFWHDAAVAGIWRENIVQGEWA